MTLLIYSCPSPFNLLPFSEIYNINVCMKNTQDIGTVFYTVLNQIRVEVCKTSALQTSMFKL